MNTPSRIVDCDEDGGGADGENESGEDGDDDGGREDDIGEDGEGTQHAHFDHCSLFRSLLGRFPHLHLLKKMWSHHNNHNNHQHSNRHQHFHPSPQEQPPYRGLPSSILTIPGVQVLSKAISG